MYYFSKAIYCTISHAATAIRTAASHLPSRAQLRSEAQTVAGNAHGHV